MLLQAGANGNVVSYNYSVNPYWDQPGFPNNAAGDLVLHGNYPYANLLEGNIVQNIVIDDSHGAQGPMNTFFRNRAEGYGLIMGSDPAPTAQNLIGNEISNDLSLFLIYGSDHFLFGNNIQGDIEPAGTQFLDDASYYMDSIPVYFQIPDAWPAIGVPHDLGTVINEAFARYQEKAYTACTNADFAPPVQALTTDIDFIIPEDSFELYPNPSKGQLFFRSQIATSVEYWEIIGIDGSIRLSGSTLPRKLDLMRLQNGFYMFSIKLEDGNRLNKPFSLVK